MTSKNKTKYKLVVPIYDIVVEVYLCKYEELPSFIKGDDEDNENGYSGFTITANKKGVSSKVCIWLDNFEWTSEGMATMVHELSHATDRIADYKMVTLDTESRAYLLDYMVGKFFYMIGRDFNSKPKIFNLKSKQK